MHLYALHIGLNRYAAPVETFDAIGDRFAGLAAGIPLWVEGVHVDGDSFIEWGEPYDDVARRSESLHAVVEFSAGTDAAAWCRAIATYRRLLLADEIGLVDLEATCDPHGVEPIPFAITDADNYAAKVGAFGARYGDIPATA